ncbi:MAG: hypothetical protein JO323_10305 [Acidobacteriia bacterium]|nr:hypothetical protein [Terriglobia bacterium]
MAKLPFLLVLVLSIAPATAQWLNYPVSGVPKSADGSPNLKAPTPRTADGKPDLSGVWTMLCPSEQGLVMCLPELYVARDFADIGRSLDGGLPYQAWAADAVKARRAENGKDDPFTHCLPGTPARIHTVPFLRKIVQTPALVLFLSEVNSSYRQVFIDGRRLPEDPNPSWNGYSTGRWDGDTLVVETNGFRDGEWLDRWGSPLTDKARMVERFRRVNYGTLEIELSVNDPKAYTRPWTVKLSQSIVLNSDLMDWTCLENEKDFSHLVGK